MRRREFLGTTAVAGLATASSTLGAGCGVWLTGSPLPGPALGPVEMSEYLARMDAGMATIAEGNVLGGVLAGRDLSDAQRAHFEAREELARMSLRSLFLVGMFRALPAEDQRHPDVQQRVFQHLPEIAEAVHGTTAMLAQLGSEDFDRISAVFAADRDFAMRLCQHLDAESDRIGSTAAVRLQLRSVAVQVSDRLRRQPPDLFIAEVLGKAEKLSDSARADPELERRVGHQVDEALRVAPASVRNAAARTRSGRQASGSGRPPANEAEDPGWVAPLVMLGVGVGLLLLGVAIGGGAVIAATVGALLLIIGFIWLFVEAVT